MYVTGLPMWTLGNIKPRVIGIISASNFQPSYISGYESSERGILKGYRVSSQVQMEVLSAEVAFCWQFPRVAATYPVFEVQGGSCFVWYTVLVERFRRGGKRCGGGEGFGWMWGGSGDKVGKVFCRFLWLIGLVFTIVS